MPLLNPHASLPQHTANRSGASVIGGEGGAPRLCRTFYCSLRFTENLERNPSQEIQRVCTTNCSRACRGSTRTPWAASRASKPLFFVISEIAHAGSLQNDPPPPPLPSAAAGAELSRFVPGGRTAAHLPHTIETQDVENQRRVLHVYPHGVSPHARQDPPQDVPDINILGEDHLPGSKQTVASNKHARTTRGTGVGFRGSKQGWHRAGKLTVQQTTQQCTLEQAKRRYAQASSAPRKNRSDG